MHACIELLDCGPFGGWAHHAETPNEDCLQCNPVPELPLCQFQLGLEVWRLFKYRRHQTKSSLFDHAGDRQGPIGLTQCGELRWI